MKYNIGCGKAKWQGFINIDCDSALEPDLVLDIRKNTLPCENDVVDEIWMFHTLEHIEKYYWARIFKEFNRALKQNGKLFLAYPEFTKCVDNWLTDKHGNREFWEHTLYGRQLYKSDYHVSIVDTATLKITLEDFGFSNIRYAEEAPPNDYNTTLSCEKQSVTVTRESLMAKEVFA